MLFGSSGKSAINVDAVGNSISTDRAIEHIGLASLTPCLFFCLDQTGNLMQPETRTTQHDTKQNTHHEVSRAHCPQGGGTADEEVVVGARPASRREDREAAVGGAAGPGGKAGRGGYFRGKKEEKNGGPRDAFRICEPPSHGAGAAAADTGIATCSSPGENPGKKKFF
jgi:hypothetical protein